MSRRHARIEAIRQNRAGLLLGHRLVDLKSSNGSFINGTKVTEPQLLADGDVIRLGQTLIVYEMLSAELETDRLSDCPATMSLHQYQTERIADLGASTGHPILIMGPTGSGKERLARRIHAGSSRVGPFVALNCSAFPRELLLSELFGHVRGAYSGADEARRGLFRAADRGTLFLDEIGELPLEQQAVLLRALQEKRVRPVGSDQEVEVDVRIISATHQPLEERMEAKEFRRDLWARLSAIPIAIGGLTRRRVEILPLLARLSGSNPPRLEVGAAERLLLYDWPDNVRALQRLDARFAMAQRETIRAVDLPAEFHAGVGSEPHRRRPLGREDLDRALREARGNVARMAEALDLHRQQVYRLLKMHRLDPKDYR